MRTRHRLYVAGFFLLLAVAPIAYQVDRAAQSLPPLDGEFPLAGLTHSVRVEFDSVAVPMVHANSREDAYRVLGYLHARAWRKYGVTKPWNWTAGNANTVSRKPPPLHSRI